MIDLDQAHDLLRRAVDTQGRNFVYNPGGKLSCLYVPDPAYPQEPMGRTGCLIGVALDLTGETRHHTFRASVDILAATYPDMMTTDAVMYFQVAQTLQDQGSTWGSAYDRAEEWRNVHLSRQTRSNNPDDGNEH